MKNELDFFLKVVRNALILSGLYFFSVWASNQTLDFNSCKPVLIFLGTYVFTELAKRYGLSIPKSRKSQKTLIF